MPGIGSAGGFGAVLYSHLIKFNKAIVFNPKTVMTYKMIKKFEDSYYEEVSRYLENSEKENNFYYKCLDLKNLIPFNT